MKRVSALVVAVMAILIVAFAVYAADSAKVKEVIDGSTILVDRNGEEVTVRYAGIAIASEDEMDACWQGAKKTNEELVKGKRIDIEPAKVDKDEDGNLLAYVFVRHAPGSIGEDVFVNENILWQGMGVMALDPPNLDHAEEYEAAQKRARKKGVGLWGDDQCRRVEAEPVDTDPECAFIGHRVSRIYHKASCSHAVRITAFNKICFKTREEAKKAGYTPCTACGD